MIDLHVHTCYSDGEHTPSEVIGFAKSLGICGISITDHDRIDGVEEAAIEGNKSGVFVVPGIEITAFEDVEVHILGYNIDIKDERLLSYVEQSKRVHDNEVARILDFFESSGMKLSYDDVAKFRDGSLITSWHFAMALAEKGYGEKVSDIWRKYFLVPPLKNRKFERIQVIDAIRLIKEIGGVAVLAHPVRVNLSDRELFEKVKCWKSIGLDGIEAIYSYNLAEDTKKFLNMAKELKLGVTVGSDFHGANVKAKVKLGLGIEDSMIKYSDMTLDDVRFIFK